MRYGDNYKYSSPLKTPSVPNNEAWSRLSFDGLEDMANDIKNIALRVRRDEHLISRAQRKRYPGHYASKPSWWSKMKLRKLRNLDEELDHITKSTTAEFIRELCVKGTIPRRDDTGDSRCLSNALYSTNNECLSALLQYGADPNAWVRSKLDWRDKGNEALAYALAKPTKLPPGHW